MNLNDLLDPHVKGTEAFRPVHGVAVEAYECPEEVQEKLREQLQGLGLSGEGDPCGWKSMWVLRGEGIRWEGITCDDCNPWSISSREATGDLSSVKDMTDLRRLELPGGKITGKLSELANLTALKILDLSNTQVSGNIAELSKLKKLRFLDLPQTQVMGDVLGLWNVTKLEGLSLAQSRVHGNFAVISRMPELTKADLSGTAVSGDLGELEDGCCKQLRELHLGVPASVGTAVLFCLWKTVAAHFETCPL